MVAVDLPSSGNGVQHAGCQWDGPSLCNVVLKVI